MLDIVQAGTRSSTIGSTRPGTGRDRPLCRTHRDALATADATTMGAAQPSTQSRKHPVPPITRGKVQVVTTPARPPVESLGERLDETMSSAGSGGWTLVAAELSSWPAVRGSRRSGGVGDVFGGAKPSPAGTGYVITGPSRGVRVLGATPAVIRKLVVTSNQMGFAMHTSHRGCHLRGAWRPRVDGPGARAVQCGGKCSGELGDIVLGDDLGARVDVGLYGLAPGRLDGGVDAE